ncbi:hypothetical protein JCGZ_23162 [Jatropha curcas]|uniref:MADS-box domain-containing protein n=1 Tax=Jatropha curcas TaxID=180498 RepID=A0A067JUW4_JATCU|nr:agamous-like MADS-box protein AGL80 [Jatropha curcas]KDP23329.1 hypothetical protein JCGZ_23162 [Jatropha curcas]
MTRKKVKLAFITNDSARKATYKKRKKGLMKKVSELSTLCGIDACAIIYSPYDSQPEVWPSPSGVQQVLSQFKNMPEMEQSKKMVTQESFTRQRISKISEQLKKQRKDNRELEMTQVMFQGLAGKLNLSNLNMMDLNDLGWLIDQYLKEIYKKFETANKNPNGIISQVAAPTAPPPLPPPPPSALAGSSDGQVERLQNNNFEMMNSNADPMQRQPWIMDWMNPQEQMGFGGEEMMMPFGENMNQTSWSNAFFNDEGGRFA